MQGLFSFGIVHPYLENEYNNTCRRVLLYLDRMREVW